MGAALISLYVSLSGLVENLCTGVLRSASDGAVCCAVPAVKLALMGGGVKLDENSRNDHKHLKMKRKFGNNFSK